MLTKTQLLKPFTVIIFLFLGSCAAPGLQHQSLIKNFELIQKTQKGTLYNHLMVNNQKPGDVLHVYIEGDGIPWRSRHQISADPTPRNPLALKLMTQDPNFALYVGRPCYFAIKSDGCSPALWTNGRYSGAVVSSMETAIKSFLHSHQVDKVILIGYSGGGVIASLLANRLEETQLLITIGANLDIDRWTAQHDYSLLDQSLNPAETISSLKMASIHLAGEKDSIVPAYLNQDFINKIDGKLMLFSGYDHLCCWEENWPVILQDIITNNTTR